jgi:hypothetical protein
MDASKSGFPLPASVFRVGRNIRVALLAHLLLLFEYPRPAFGIGVPR